MSDPGLSHRLRQRSRRAGFMIGLSMVLTIALCAVGFTVIYTALDGFTSDFVSQTDVTPTEVEQVAEQDTGGPAVPPTAASESGGQTTNENTAEEPAPTPTAPPDDGTDAPEESEENASGFNPDYQLGSVTVNLRSGPSTSNSIITALPPSTPLEYLDEDAPTDSPSDGERWMRFVTEDGVEGWIREIDVTSYEP